MQRLLSYRAAQVVRSLMQGANQERWLSIRGHLRTLAQASPSAFLDCLEAELREPEPAIRAIMGTTEGLMSGECLRTNLLWALELLAWHPIHFSRVAEIVFGLRRLEVEDNWSNSPKSTARSLFRAWLPATALSAAERMAGVGLSVVRGGRCLCRSRLSDRGLARAVPARPRVTRAIPRACGSSAGCRLPRESGRGRRDRGPDPRRR